MNEMIERVARAIATTNGDDFDALPASKLEWIFGRGEFGGRYRGINEPRKPDYLDMARAAIEAMRQPTRSMVEAGTNADWVGENEGLAGCSIMPNEGYSDTVEHIGIWPAMIDAALTET